MLKSLNFKMFFFKIKRHTDTAHHLFKQLERYEISDCLFKLHFNNKMNPTRKHAKIRKKADVYTKRSVP